MQLVLPYNYGQTLRVSCSFRMVASGGTGGSKSGGEKGTPGDEKGTSGGEKVKSGVEN